MLYRKTIPDYAHAKYFFEYCIKNKNEHNNIAQLR